MKKKTILIIVALALVGAFAITLYNKQKPCTPNGKVVCFDDESERYLVEDDAELTIYVKSAAQKAYLLREIKNVVAEASQFTLQVKVNPQIKAWDAVHELDVDVFYIQQAEAAMMIDHLMVVDENFVNDRSSLGIYHLSETINQVKHVFLPTTYEGLLFMYNKTLLEQLGFDVERVDEKNRLVELNNWQAIMDLTDAWHQEKPLKKLNSIFPFNVREPWQFYPFLTAGGWQMFADDDIEDPGFLSLDFFNSLVFVDQLFSTDWYFNRSLEQTWNYENALINNETLFSLASMWVDWDAISELKNQEYSYSAFPDYESNNLTPLVKVDGLVIKANPYPSLSHAVVSVLHKLEGVQVLLDDGEFNLVIAHDEFEQLTMDDKQYEKSLAYSYSVIEPLVALANNPHILGWDFYLQGNLFDVIQQIHSEELTIEQGQAQLVELYDAWYHQNNQ
ncbi:MAG: hypothetical protein GX845_01115 [Erysipelothrix sp.]|nr:hypothetical protein [Erysipelothrix sp.]